MDVATFVQGRNCYDGSEKWMSRDPSIGTVGGRVLVERLGGPDSDRVCACSLLRNRVCEGQKISVDSGRFSG